MVLWGVERRVRRAVDDANWVAVMELVRKHGVAATRVTTDQHGRTLLHDAAFRGKTQAVATLLECGADVAARTRQGATPLHAAARADRPAVCDLLVKRGADPDAVDNHGTAALHEAAWRGHRAVVKTLLAHGANPNVKSDTGHRPIDLSRGFCGKEIEKLLKRAMEANGTYDDASVTTSSDDKGASDVTSVDADATVPETAAALPTATTVRFNVP